jgi:hypothetical protein
VHSPTYAFGLIRADHAWDLEAQQNAELRLFRSESLSRR